jgi:hypothetical protein
MDSPNTKISRENRSLVGVRKFIAERIITYLVRMKNRDFHLQIEILGLQTGFSDCYLPFYA